MKNTTKTPTWNEVIELAQRVDTLIKGDSTNEDISKWKVPQKVTINGVEINGIYCVMNQGFYESGEYVVIKDVTDDTLEHEVDALQITIDSETNGDYIRITKSDIEQAFTMFTNLLKD